MGSQRDHSHYWNRENKIISDDHRIACRQIIDVRGIHHDTQHRPAARCDQQQKEGDDELSTFERLAGFLDKDGV